MEDILCSSFMADCNLIASEDYAISQDFVCFKEMNEVSASDIHYFLEDSDEIAELLSLINMSIQINIDEEQWESSEIASILSRKPSMASGSNCKYLALTSSKLYHPQPRKISLAGRVLFNSTAAQVSAKSTWAESNNLNSQCSVKGL